MIESMGSKAEHNSDLKRVAATLNHKTGEMVAEMSYSCEHIQYKIRGTVEIHDHWAYNNSPGNIIRPMEPPRAPFPNDPLFKLNHEYDPFYSRIISVANGLDEKHAMQFQDIIPIPPYHRWWYATMGVRKESGHDTHTIQRVLQLNRPLKIQSLLKLGSMLFSKETVDVL